MIHPDDSERPRLRFVFQAAAFTRSRDSSESLRLKARETTMKRAAGVPTASLVTAGETMDRGGWGEPQRLPTLEGHTPTSGCQRVIFLGGA